MMPGRPIMKKHIIDSRHEDDMRHITPKEKAADRAAVRAARSQRNPRKMMRKK